MLIVHDMDRACVAVDEYVIAKAVGQVILREPGDDRPSPFALRVLVPNIVRNTHTRVKFKGFFHALARFLGICRKVFGRQRLALRAPLQKLVRLRTFARGLAIGLARRDRR